MPVLVVGAEGAVGGRAVDLLCLRRGETRVFLDRDRDDAADPAPFRARGCKVARGSLEDEGHVESALEQVHTVLHLSGRPSDDPDTWLDRCATVVSGSIAAGCRRFVLLSDAAVPPGAGNPWLEALAEAEDMIADAPLESVVLRSALIYGPGDPHTVALAAGAAGVAPVGSHWPVHAHDVATIAVAVDDNRDLDTSLHVVVDVAGPRRLATAEILHHLSAAIPTAEGPPLPAAALELLSRDVPRPEGALGEQGTAIEDVGTLDTGRPV